MAGTKEPRNRIWTGIKGRLTIATVLLSIVFITVFALFIYYAEKEPQLSEALVALGTLILALVTSLSIINSREQGKREKREHLIDETIRWAEDAATTGLKPPSEAMIGARSVHQIYNYTRARVQGESFGFQLLIVRSVYFERVAAHLKGDIAGLVKTLTSELRNHDVLLDVAFYLVPSDPSDKTEEEKYEQASNKVADHRLVLNQAASNVIKEATRLKIEEPG